MRLVLWMLATLGPALAFAQEPTTVASLWTADEGAARPRLVQLLDGLTSASAGGVTFWYDAAGDAYGSADHEPVADPQAWAEAWVDLNSWRRLDPEAFVPGPMNALLGVVGLADAREVTIRAGLTGEIVAEWGRRSDDPQTVPLHTIVVARLVADESGCEVWSFGPVGIGVMIAGVVRAGLALEEGERAPSDWAYADAWVRGRSELLRSLSRSTTRSAAVLTPGLEAAIVFWFDPAVKAASLERAAMRIAPGGVPEVTLRGKSIRPTFAVAESEEGPVVVIAPTQRDLEGVIAALGLRSVSGGDRP